MSVPVQRTSASVIGIMAALFLASAIVAGQRRRVLTVLRVGALVALPLATWSNAGRSFGLVVATAVLVAHSALVGPWSSPPGRGERSGRPGRISAAVLACSSLAAGQVLWARTGAVITGLAGPAVGGAVVLVRRRYPELFVSADEALAAALATVRQRGLDLAASARSALGGRRAVWTAAGVAFALRLLVVAVNADVPFTGDLADIPDALLDLGNGVLEGRGLYRDGTLVTSWPPVYPHFLAVWLGVESLVGIGSVRFWVGFGHSLLAGLSILAVGMLVRRRVDPAIGAVTAFVLALWPNQLVNAAVVLTEGVFTPLYSFGVVVLLWRDRPNTAQVLGAGALFGAAVLTRPAGSAVVLAAMLVVFTLWRANMRRALVSAALVAAAFMASLAPWLLYTNAVLGTPVLSSFNGYNLCLGHSDGATGEFDPTRCAPRSGESVLDAEARMRSEAIEWALDHPAQEVVLVVRRFVATIVGDYYSTFHLPGPGYDSPLPRLGVVLVSQTWWIAAVVLGVRGYWTRRGDRFYRSAAILWGAVLLGPLVTIGDTRFHDPLLPFVAMCVATAVVTWQRDRRRQRGLQGPVHPVLPSGVPIEAAPGGQGTGRGA